MHRITLIFVMSLTHLILFGQVFSIGSMSDMGKNFFQPVVSADTLLQESGLFGLGPYGLMQGELTIVNGRPLVGKSAEDGRLTVIVDPRAKAPFFVYSYVNEWHSNELVVEADNANDIQTAIEMYAIENDVSLDEPFPFRIKGIIDSIEIHVVLPRSSEVPGYIEGKKSQKYQFQNVAGEIVGFYSQSGQGIYTHKDSYVHLHFIDDGQKIVGHIDDLKIQSKKMNLLLPNQ